MLTRLISDPWYYMYWSASVCCFSQQAWPTGTQQILIPSSWQQVPGVAIHSSAHQSNVTESPLETLHANASTQQGHSWRWVNQRLLSPSNLIIVSQMWTSILKFDIWEISVIDITMQMCIFKRCIFAKYLLLKVHIFTALNTHHLFGSYDWSWSFIWNDHLSLTLTY